MRAALYFHTLRHLRPKQVTSRLLAPFRKSRPDLSPAPARRARTAEWVFPPRRPPSQLAPDRFRFLNVERQLQGAPDWNHPGWPKLWLYNLHYFDDIGAPGFALTLERWIAENPPAAGNGWEPYPTSLRIVNWIKWSLAGNTLTPAALHSMAIQCRHLMSHLEWHLLGNHLFANAKALLCAGLFFDGAEARRWLEQGRQILRRELPEQVLEDGGHFELSPLYHSIILEDVLDLENLSRVYGNALAEHRLDLHAARMLGWLKAMTHPNGEIAFFNDAALGIASPPRELLEYAARLGIEAGPHAEHLEASGYIRLQSGPASAILDVARIGPDYIPGHAHADTLSFELSLFGRRVIVNSGTGTYETSPERLCQRATAAHSTLEINGESSSQVWGSFRVARRARPFDLSIGHDGPLTRVTCAHDGYRRLPGRPVHRREWHLAADSLRVTDTVEGKFNKAMARFYFHPDCAVLRADERSGELAVGQEARLTWRIENGRGRIVDSTYHPQFGLSVASRCLLIETVDSPLTVVFNWRG